MSSRFGSSRDPGQLELGEIRRQSSLVLDDGGCGSFLGIVHIGSRSGRKGRLRLERRRCSSGFEGLPSRGKEVSES